MISSIKYLTSEEDLFKLKQVLKLFWEDLLHQRILENFVMLEIFHGPYMFTIQNLFINSFTPL